MADQQDQSSSGGSVEKASAPADTSKQLRGKSSGSASASGSGVGGTAYRKRHSPGIATSVVGEKRRRQNITDPPQSNETSNVPQQSHHRRPVDTCSKVDQGKVKAERRNYGGGLGTPVGKSATRSFIFYHSIYQNSMVRQFQVLPYVSNTANSKKKSFQGKVNF